HGSRPDPWTPGSRSGRCCFSWALPTPSRSPKVVDQRHHFQLVAYHEWLGAAPVALERGLVVVEAGATVGGLRVLDFHQSVLPGHADHDVGEAREPGVVQVGN